MPKDTIYYHLIEVAAIIIFAGGVAANLAFWTLGSAGGAGSSRWGRLGRLLADLLDALFRTGGWGRLAANVLLQRQLLQESAYRWLIHICLSWGVAELFFVGSLGNMLVDLHIIDLSKDAPWFALINDLGGLALLVGVILAGHRRYLLKERQVVTVGEDGLVLGWLLVLAVSGFLLNGARILAEAVPTTLAGYSFIGYGVAMAIAPLAEDWAAIHQAIWWLHVVLAFGLIAYLPFSKLWHIFASPLSIAMGVPVEEPQV